MLTGEFEHQLDERGRVAIHKSFRATLEDGGFVTRGWYGCLFLFSLKYWNSIEDKLNAVGLTDMDGDVVKQFFSGGAKVWLDGQGRFVLPSVLCEFAGITDKDEVIVRGVINRIEIWAKDRWVAYQNDQFKPAQIIEKAKAVGL